MWFDPEHPDHATVSLAEAGPASLWPGLTLGGLLLVVGAIVLVRTLL